MKHDRLRLQKSRNTDAGEVYTSVALKLAVSVKLGVDVAPKPQLPALVG